MLKNIPAQCWNHYDDRLGGRNYTETRIRKECDGDLLPLNLVAQCGLNNFATGVANMV